MTANFPTPLPQPGHPAHDPERHAQRAPTQHPQTQRATYDQAPHAGAPASHTYSPSPYVQPAYGPATDWQPAAAERPGRPAAVVVASVLAWCGAALLLCVGVVIALVGPQLIDADPVLSADPEVAAFPDWGMTAVGVVIAAWGAVVALGGVLAWFRQLAGAIVLSLLTLLFSLMVLTTPGEATDLPLTLGLVGYCLAATLPLYGRSARTFYRGRGQRLR